jgi:hypothetical protein
MEKGLGWVCFLLNVFFVFGMDETPGVYRAVKNGAFVLVFL